MNHKKLIFNDYLELYKIFLEVKSFYDFEVINIKNLEDLKSEIKKSENYLIMTKNKNLKLDNLIVLKNLPIKFRKLIENINIEFLKNNFSKKSSIKIGIYEINLNSRQISIKNNSLRLTEKEIKTIIYIAKSSNPVTINELQKKIWKYKSELETHTVETHIHRLRKKILEKFKIENFIISTKNGYKIN
tara:strand:+ start:482 stop:1045 length:564 start_codon:yes stop_codon:yes gene_type:complete